MTGLTSGKKVVTYQRQRVGFSTAPSKPLLGFPFHQSYLGNFHELRFLVGSVFMFTYFSDSFIAPFASLEVKTILSVSNSVHCPVLETIIYASGFESNLLWKAITQAQEEVLNPISVPFKPFSKSADQSSVK